MRDAKTGMRAAGLALLMGTTSACAVAHNDVLVFGTSTTIGLNVETASTNGAAPSIVLGYEREEAVWMPLLANGQDSGLNFCPATRTRNQDNTWPACPTPPTYPLPAGMYRSEVWDDDGTKLLRTDTYSVFASLGAKFNGAAARDNVNAGGGIAQFFATGNAALNISSNTALVTALKLDASSADAQARAVSAAAGTPSVAVAMATDNESYAALELCTKGADNGWHWKEILDAIPEGAVTLRDMQYLTELQQDELPELLTDRRLRTAVLAAARSTPLC